jgi:hypothetical protein
VLDRALAQSLPRVPRVPLPLVVEPDPSGVVRRLSAALGPVIGPIIGPI